MTLNDLARVTRNVDGIALALESLAADEIAVPIHGKTQAGLQR